ncbi:MAG: TetR/AcrR family transcriptional regulator [Pseudonocardia sediminis]
MTTGAVSPRRADTRRNHDRILAVAAESLAQLGEVSFNAVAKQAGVGVGTVYRHFPNPEALILAVYRLELRHLVEVVPGLLATHTPEGAFRAWAADHLSHYLMTKRGLIDALRAASTGKGELPSDVYEAAQEAMIGAVTTLVDANVAAGTVGADLDPATVLRGLAGLMLLDSTGDWRREAEGLIDLLWRGMSAGRT